jgi:hypothetical protein
MALDAQERSTRGIERRTERRQRLTWYSFSMIRTSGKLTLAAFTNNSRTSPGPGEHLRRRASPVVRTPCRGRLSSDRFYSVLLTIRRDLPMDATFHHGESGTRTEPSPGSSYFEIGGLHVEATLLT